MVHPKTLRQAANTVNGSSMLAELGLLFGSLQNTVASLHANTVATNASTFKMNDMREKTAQTLSVLDKRVETAEQNRLVDRVRLGGLIVEMAQKEGLGMHTAQ